MTEQQLRAALERPLDMAVFTGAAAVPFPPRRETCACGDLELVDTDVAPDEVDDRFLHAREICFLLDDEELDHA